MLQASEVLALLSATILLPLIWRSLSSLRLAGRELLRVGLLSILVAYAATVIEGFVAFDFFNAVEHGAYAVAGILLVLFGANIARRLGRAR